MTIQGTPPMTHEPPPWANSEVSPVPALPSLALTIPVQAVGQPHRGLRQQVWGKLGGAGLGLLAQPQPQEELQLGTDLARGCPWCLCGKEVCWGLRGLLFLPQLGPKSCGHKTHPALIVKLCPSSTLASPHALGLSFKGISAEKSCPAILSKQVLPTLLVSVISFLAIPIGCDYSS